MNEILRILDACMVLHLGLCDEDWPYVVPLNYGYTFEEGKLTLYMHGATTGYKYDLIRKNPKISFEMDCEVTPFEGKTACQYGTTYSCVMGRGTAKIIEDAAEKERALSVFMKTQTGKEFEFNEKLVSIVNVIKVEVTEFSAKKRPLPEGMK